MKSLTIVSVGVGVAILGSYLWNKVKSKNVWMNSIIDRVRVHLIECGTDSVQIVKKLELLSRLSCYEEKFLDDIIFPEDIDVSFDDFGGYESQIKDVKNTVLLAFKRSKNRLVEPPRGVLFYGPPGTGKTMFAKIIAKECKAIFINVRVAALQDKYYGESSKLIEGLFGLSRKLSPCVLFVDEIDSVLGKRGEWNEQEYSRVFKTQFMQLWEGLITNNIDGGSDRVIILGASNRPDDLDDAIKRRMPRKIQFKLPNLEERLEIFSKILRHSKLEHNVDMQRLSQLSSGYSGSDIKELCKYAATLAFSEQAETDNDCVISRNHLLAAFKHIRPNNNE